MLYVPPLFLLLLALLAFVLGACVGSFINCAALRRETGESVLKGRSHCESCREVLAPGELIPILSWFLQGGKCKHCAAPLSARYPLTEFLCGLAFALVVWVQGSSLAGLSCQTIEYMVLLSLLLYASLVDIDSRTIPDGVIVAALVLHLVYLVVAGPLLGIIDARAAVIDSLIGAFAICVPLVVIVMVADRVFGRDSMGGGDLKLFFVAGFYFGWRACLFLIIIACVIGIVSALYAQRKEMRELQQRKNMLDEVGFEGQAEELSLRYRPITFGPAIAAAMFITMLIGNQLVWWYAGLF